MQSAVVIDRSAADRELAAAALERAGFQVFSASEGHAGLEMVREKKPAVLVVEILVPGLHGFTICQEVRGDAELRRRTRIIVVSSKSYPADIKKALELGAISYLVKPVSVEQLTAAIGQAMQAAPMPQGELARQAALEGYRVLDTPPESALDDLTRLASMICGTPVALISLVDNDRQWFKARVGADIEQTSRQVAFCAHGILQRDIFEVPDAIADKRFRTNVLVTVEPPGVRFYAGAPLTAPGGEAIGMLCVLDQVPRQLDNFQRECLKILSRAVMAHLELRRQTLSTQTAGAAAQ